MTFFYVFIIFIEKFLEKFIQPLGFEITIFRHHKFMR